MEIDDIKVRWVEYRFSLLPESIPKRKPTWAVAQKSGIPMMINTRTRLKCFWYWSGGIVYMFLGRDNELIYLFCEPFCHHDYLRTTGRTGPAQSGGCGELTDWNPVIFWGLEVGNG